MTRKEPQTLSMEINHTKVYFPEGVSVHRAAEINGVYIPSLCSHKDLSPFGGCRMCMVEIEGIRGYPLSCDTIARQGMKVLTDTVMLGELRKDILKLILSEHPSSCLVCDEKTECREYQGTIRKAGVTTGCRFCPNDNQCELQVVVDKLGVTEIDYPIYYHGYEPEQDDPFYDRDYNICILCGRCVRMCQEVRGASVLAFTYRGPRVKIAPAFGRSHIEAGCEFCGACVDVCPTGALADKISKWDGKPDGFHVSTCPFCAIGCQVELYHKDGRFSKVRANLDPEINDRQLCVKGRFGMPEVTHHFDRARKPMLLKGSFFREVDWKEALEKVAEVLKGVKPEEFMMMVSPDLTNESLFAAQKFVRECIGSNNIDSTARKELAGGPGLWTKLFSKPISITGIAKADAILAVGFDSRFDFSVACVMVRRAIAAGAKLITISADDNNIAKYTSDWLRPLTGTEAEIFQFFSEKLTGKNPDPLTVSKITSVDVSLLEKTGEILCSEKDITVIVGPQMFHYSDNRSLVNSLLILSNLDKINLVPLYFGSNSRGALEMSVFPEKSSISKATPRIIYLAGDIPFTERPACDFLIVQDIYMPPFKVDAFLPASSFVEAAGTLINIEGRVQEVVQIECLPQGLVTGFMQPDWKIFSDLANLIKPGLMNYESDNDIRAEIHGVIPDFPETPDRKPRCMKPLMDLEIVRSATGSLKHGEFLQAAGPGRYRHRGIDLVSKVRGLKELTL